MVESLILRLDTMTDTMTHFCWRKIDLTKNLDSDYLAHGAATLWTLHALTSPKETRSSALLFCQLLS
jgi:hypothetical protein